MAVDSGLTCTYDAVRTAVFASLTGTVFTSGPAESITQHVTLILPDGEVGPTNSPGFSYTSRFVPVGSTFYRDEFVVPDILVIIRLSGTLYQIWNGPGPGAGYPTVASSFTFASGDIIAVYPSTTGSFPYTIPYEVPVLFYTQVCAVVPPEAAGGGAGGTPVPPYSVSIHCSWRRVYNAYKLTVPGTDTLLPQLGGPIPT